MVNGAYRNGQKSVSLSFFPRAWTEEEIKLLGSKPDAEVAKLVGRSVEAVKQQRVNLV